MQPTAPCHDWRAALTGLAECEPLIQAARDLVAARAVDLETVLARAREATALGAILRETVASLATAAGEPEPTWADHTELGVVLETLEARASARTNRGRERVLGLAATLRAGRVVNKFTGRANPRSDCLREPAADELEAAAGTTGLAFPGPDVGDWLEWAWAHPSEQFVVLLDSLGHRFPSVCELLEAIEPSAWVPGSPAPLPSLPTAPTHAPAVEAQPGPAPAAAPDGEQHQRPGGVLVEAQPGPAPVAPPPRSRTATNKISVKSLGWGHSPLPTARRAFIIKRPVAQSSARPARSDAPRAQPESEIPSAGAVESEPSASESPATGSPDSVPAPVPVPAPPPEPAPRIAPAEAVGPKPFVFELPALGSPNTVPAPTPDEPPITPDEIERFCVAGDYLRAALLAFAREAAGAAPCGPSGRAALVAHHAVSGSPAAPWPDWCADAVAANETVAARPADAHLVYLAAQCQAVSGGPDPLAADAAGFLLCAFNDLPAVRRWLDELAAVRAVPGLLDQLRARGAATDPRAEYTKHRAAFVEYAKRANQMPAGAAYHHRQDKFLNQQPAGRRLRLLLDPASPPKEVRGENRDIEAFLSQQPEEVTRLWLRSSSGLTLNRNQPQVLAESAAQYLRLAAAAWHSARAVAQSGVSANVLDQHRAELVKKRPAAAAAARGRPWAALFEKLSAEVARDPN